MAGRAVTPARHPALPQLWRSDSGRGVASSPRRPLPADWPLPTPTTVSQRHACSGTRNRPSGPRSVACQHAGPSVLGLQCTASACGGRRVPEMSSMRMPGTTVVQTCLYTHTRAAHCAVQACGRSLAVPPARAAPPALDRPPKKPQGPRSLGPAHPTAVWTRS